MQITFLNQQSSLVFKYKHDRVNTFPLIRYVNDMSKFWKNPVFFYSIAYAIQLWHPKKSCLFDLFCRTTSISSTVGLLHLLGYLLAFLSKPWAPNTKACPLCYRSSYHIIIILFHLFNAHDSDAKHSFVKMIVHGLELFYSIALKFLSCCRWMAQLYDFWHIVCQCC